MFADTHAQAAGFTPQSEVKAAGLTELAYALTLCRHKAFQ